MNTLEAIDFYKKLNAYKKVEHFSQKVSFAIGYNIKALNPLMESVKEATTPPKRIVEMEQKYNKLVLLHAKKDEKGAPIKAGDNKYSVENPDAFKVEVDKLQEEYQEDMDKWTKCQEELKAAFKDETPEISLKKVKIDEFPAQTAPVVFADLMMMIDEI